MEAGRGADVASPGPSCLYWLVHSTTFKRTFLGPSTGLGHGEIPVPKTDRGEMEPMGKCVGEALSRQKSMHRPWG